MLRKEQALSEDSAFLKEQMEKLLKVRALLDIHIILILCILFCKVVGAVQ